MSDQEILSEIESYLISIKEVYGAFVHNDLAYLHSYKVQKSNLSEETIRSIYNLREIGIDATQYLPPDLRVEMNEATINVVRHKIDWSMLSQTQNGDGYTKSSIMKHPSNIYKAYTITVTEPRDCGAKMTADICRDFLNICYRASDNFALSWEKIETSPKYHCVLVGKEIKKEE